MFTELIYTWLAIFTGYLSFIKLSLFEGGELFSTCLVILITVSITLSQNLVVASFVTKSIINYT